MKQGDRVKIYQKPLTKKDYEGMATLVKRFDNRKDKGYEDWYVKFDTDSDLSSPVLRRIKK